MATKSPKQQAMDYLRSEQHNLVSRMRQEGDAYYEADSGSPAEAKSAEALVVLGERLGRVRAALAAVQEGV